MKKIFFVFIILILGIFAFSCGEEPKEKVLITGLESPIIPSEIKIGEKISFKEGLTVKLSSTDELVDASIPNEYFEVFIETSTPNIIEIDGIEVTAKQIGNASFKLIVKTDDDKKELSFSVNVYDSRKITYETDGGSLTDAIYEYRIGEEYTLPIPVKAGFSFLGWTKEGSESYIKKIEKTDNTDLKFIAHYEKLQVESKITFILDGGSLLSELKTYIEGTKTTLPLAKKEGYNFLGWKTATGKLINEIDESMSGNLVLTASYERLPLTEIEYNLNGGSFSWTTGSVSNPANGIDKDSNLPEIFMGDFYYYLKSYDLLGSEKVCEKLRPLGEEWSTFSAKLSDPVAMYNNNSANGYKVNDGYNQFFWDSIVDNKPIGGFFGTSPYKEKYASLFDAVYPFIKVKYSSVASEPEKLEPCFSFILDGYFYGTQGLISGNEEFNSFRSKIVEAPKVIKEANGEVILPTPFKEGYGFAGWYDNENLTGNKIEKITKNCALYAKWFDLNTKTPVHKLTFVLDGGTANLISELKETNEYVLPIPVKDGFSFLGWSLTKGGTEYIEKISKGNKTDLTIYANWEEKGDTIRIKYVYDAGHTPTHKAANMEEFSAFFFKEYHDFSGSSLSVEEFKKAALAKWSAGSEYTAAKLFVTSGAEEYNDTYFINAKGNELWREWFNAFDKQVTNINGTQNAWGQPYVAHKRLSEIFGSGASYWTAARLQAVYEAYPIPAELVTSFKIGDKLELVGLVTEDGRDFLGWYNGDTKITNTSEITDNITLTAHWSASTPVETFTVTNKIDKMLRLAKYKLEYNITPLNATNKKVSFESSDKNIISVDEEGNLTALKDGTVMITVHCLDNPSLDVKFSVTVYIDSFLDVDIDTTVLAPSEKAELNVIPYKLDGKKLIYTSSDETVVSIDDKGIISAKKVGSAKVKVYVESNNEIYQELVINVIDPTDKAYKIIGDAHNSSIHVTRDLNVAYAYLADVFVSASDLLFNRKFTIDTQFEDVQAKNSSNHGGKMGPIEFITVHYTAGVPESSGAKNTASYMCNSDSVSIHYTTGNDGIFHCLDNTLEAWHAGDGSTKLEWIKTGVKAEANVKPVWGCVKNSKSPTGYYFSLNGVETTIQVPTTGKTSSGATKTMTDPNKCFTYFGPAWKVVNGEYYMGNTWACFTQTLDGAISSRGGNMNSIGMETACNKGSDLWLTYQITAQLVARLLTEYKLGFERVVGHNMFSGKDCPQTLLANNGELWELFMECVKSEYSLYNDLANYEISCKSNNKDILDDNGRIINIPDYSTTVSYTVSVKDKSTGATTSKTFTSIVHGRYTE